MSGESQIHGSIGGNVSLIETLRYDPQEGFIRKALHLERLAASAKALGFRYDEALVDLALQEKMEDDSSLRIRIELSQDGSCEVTAQPFTLQSTETCWKLAISKTRLNSSDELITHKTSRRATYEAARSEYDEQTANEVILLNEHGQICEGTITNIFVRFDDDTLHTPPLSCGLLPGVLRRELLQRGQAMETVLIPDNLESAREVFVGNSLRGLIAARLI